MNKLIIVALFIGFVMLFGCQTMPDQGVVVADNAPPETPSNNITLSCDNPLKGQVNITVYENSSDSELRKIMFDNYVSGDIVYFDYHYQMADMRTWTFEGNRIFRSFNCSGAGYFLECKYGSISRMNCTLE